MKEKNFGELLAYHIQNTPLRQLEKRTADLKVFLGRFRIPFSTIARWQNSGANPPRIDGHKLATLGRVLNLSYSELNELFELATKTNLTAFLNQLSYEDEDIQQYWFEKKISDGFSSAPNPPKIFIDHEESLEKVVTRIFKRRISPICVIQGIHGIGKTTLASHIAWEYKGMFPDGVLWIDFMKTPTVQDAIVEIALSFNFPSELFENPIVLKSKVRHFLANHNLLIVLDHVTTKLDLRDFVPPQMPGFVLICTNDSQINIRLDYRPSIQLSLFSETASLELFEAILDRQFDHEEIKALKKISKLVGFLPLGLELMASRINESFNKSIHYHLNQLRKQLADSYQTYLDSDNFAIRAIFDFIVDNLSNHEKEVFGILSHFDGDITLDAVQSITGKTAFQLDPMISKLVNCSLIRVSERRSEAMKLHIHPFWRLLGRQLVSIENYIERFGAYYTNQFPKIIKRTSQKHRHAKFYLEKENILFVLRNCAHFGLKHQFVEGLLAYGRLMRDLGYYTKILDFLEEGERFAHELNSAESTIQIRVLSATLLRRRGNLEDMAKAGEKLKLAVEQATDLDNKELLSKSLLAQGDYYYRSGMLQESHTAFERGISYVEGSNNKPMIAQFYINLGVVNTELRDYQAAMNYFKQAQQHIERPMQQIKLYQNRGKLYSQMGQQYRAAAQSDYEAGLQQAEEMNNLELISRLSGNLGLLYLANLEEILDAKQNVYNQQKARQYLSRGNLAAERLGNMQQIARHQSNLGQLEQKLGDLSTAEVHFNQGIELAQKGGYRADEVVMTNNLGEALLQHGQIYSASKVFTKALDLAQELNIQSEIERSQKGLSDC